MTERDWDGKQKQPGWAKGKRVWFRNDAVSLMAKGANGGHDSGLLASDRDHMTLNGLAVLVDFPDGQREVLRDRLRLSPPRGPKPKEPTPQVRKEAIDPAFGEELTIYDALGPA